MLSSPLHRFIMKNDIEMTINGNGNDKDEDDSYIEPKAKVQVKDKVKIEAKGRLGGNRDDLVAVEGVVDGVMENNDDEEDIATKAIRDLKVGIDIPLISIYFHIHIDIGSI